jgi:outer membrane protein assembly factor BamB
MIHRFTWALLVSAVCSLAASGADWPNWRGPFENGFSPDTGLPDKIDGNVLWKKPFGSRSTPLVLGDRLYLLNYDADKNKDGSDVHETIMERVLCLDANTGKKIWQHTFPVFHTDIVTSRLGWTNLAADPATGYVYAHGTQGLFMCLDGQKGTVVWQHSMGEEFGRISGYGGRVTSPMVDGNLVILGMCSSNWGDQTKPANRFIAFDKRTGVVAWLSEAASFKGTYYSAPVVAPIGGQRLLICGGSDGTVFALQVHTGKPVWSYHVSVASINSSPVVDGNYVYIGHGEESPDTNVQGRVTCLDASDGSPKLVWKVDGIKARYASPIFHEGRLYMPDDGGRLYCLDGKTGDQLWKFNYGSSEVRGSPVMGDGKIYVGESGSNFHILAPGPKKCRNLHSEFFPGRNGVNVELNGTPAIANGRVYFTTADDIYCLGTKAGVGAKLPPSDTSAVMVGKITHLQIVPAEVALHSGGSTTFKARGFDAHGNFVKEVEAKWSLPAPPLPPGAKAAPPALKGEITSDGKLTVDTKMPTQQSIVVAEYDGVTGKARVRVAPHLPYANDFEKIPDGAAPAGWVNTQGKYLVKTVDGNKVLAKVNNKFSPLISRGQAYITLPTAKDYTIQCDVQGTKVGNDMPEVGIGANRYTLILAGNVQKLRLMSWDALPRIDKTIDYTWKPKTWYTLKLATDIENGKGVIRGKVWPKGEKEPAKWTLEVTDSRAIPEGSATLYGYVTGNFNDQPGTEIYYDNLKITPNQGAAKAGPQSSAVTIRPDLSCEASAQRLNPRMPIAWLRR